VIGLSEVYLARHGETEWSLSGQHTGLTNLPLTRRGEINAVRLGERLQGMTFDSVFVSTLERARRTCELAGFGAQARVDPDLVEWNYGAYEGKTTAEIRAERPGWQIFRDGCVGGESVSDVIVRADRVIARLRIAGQRVLVFSSGHFLRIVAARWLRLGAEAGGWLHLSTATLSALGYEHSLDEPVIRLWNDERHVLPLGVSA
jgi:probable phosphoglycerate mutase